MLRSDILACQGLRGNTFFLQGSAFLADILSLSTAKFGQKIIEARVIMIFLMILVVVPNKKSAIFQKHCVLFGAERDMK